MLRIAICDDDQVCRATAENMIRRLAEEEALTVCVLGYSSGEELLADYPENLDILLLDIEMPGINGIETAREIRKTDPELTMVFMTSFAQYAIEGYTVKAYRYLLKPLGYPSFSQELREVFRTLYYRCDPDIVVRNDQGLFRLTVKDIQYAETAPNKHVRIHSAANSVLCYQTMQSVEGLLEPYRMFFRCHTSFLINFHAVSEITGNDVRLISGALIPVSKHRRKDMLTEYTRFLGRLI